MFYGRFTPQTGECYTFYISKDEKTLVADELKEAGEILEKALVDFKKRNPQVYFECVNNVCLVENLTDAGYLELHQILSTVFTYSKYL